MTQRLNHSTGRGGASKNLPLPLGEGKGEGLRRFMRPFIAASLLACASLARALPDTALQPAFDQFTQASAGKASPEAAAKAFAALRAQEPANPVLLAYEGAATAMQARDTLLPWKKMRYTDDGLALIDKALAMLGPQHDALLHRGTPASLEVKFTAANTFLAMPKMMNRHERGQKLLAEVAASPLLAAAPAPFKAQVAQAQQRLQQARP